MTEPGIMKDFTTTRPAVVRFKLDDDVFEAVPQISAINALDFSSRYSSLSDKNVSLEEATAMIHELIRMVLLPESANRFLDRMHSQTNPIGVDKFYEVLNWIFEFYTERPTQPGSDSSTGSDTRVDGTTSTVSTSPVG